jgi:serine/threonine-protein kinase
VTHVFGDAIPTEIVAIVERATASDSARRYSSVEDLADDLRRFLRGEAVVARPDTRWQKAVRTVARHRQAAALIVLGFALVSMATIAGLLWRHDRAMQAERVREQRIQAWVKDVADQGDRLQMRLLDVQGKFEAMAAGLAHASQFGQASAAPLTWIGDSSSISTGDHLDGAFDVLPGASRPAVEPLARQLVTLRRSEEEIFEVVGRALGRAAAPGNASPSSSSALADATGLHALRAAFDSGLLYIFPSSARNRRQDPRRLEWYTESRTDSVRWTLMQADDDDARELLLSTAITDEDGRRVGAASLVLSLDHILENLVREHPIPGVRATILLVRDGVPVAIHTTDGAQNLREAVLKLPLAEMARDENENETGVFETDRLGGTHLVAFDRIHPIEWTLVAIVDARDLFR